MNRIDSKHTQNQDKLLYRIGKKMMMMKNEHLSAEQQAKLMMMIMMGTLAPTNKQNIEDSQFFFQFTF